MPLIPDYSQYDLKQLYEVLRKGDLEAFPEQLAAVKREIEIKGGNPNISRRDSSLRALPFYKDIRRWVRRNVYQAPTPALKLVRWIVGLEYGFALLMLIHVLLHSLVTQDLSEAVMACIIILFWTVMCWIGVASMRVTLRKISNKLAVEMAWLTALGLAPLSANFYVYLGIYFISKLRPSSYLSGVIVAYVVGFYMPFVLLTCYLKYKYRDDEF